MLVRMIYIEYNSNLQMFQRIVHTMILVLIIILNIMRTKQWFVLKIVQ